MILHLTNEAMAIGISVFGGIPITWACAKYMHHRLKAQFPEEFAERHSDPWLGFIMGGLERAIITMLTIWMPQSVGPIVGALLAVKAVGAWSGANTTFPYRVRFFTALVGSLVSAGWALALGIWATAP